MADTIGEIAVFFRAKAMSDVTQILSQIEAGDCHASSQLLPLVYDELKKLAEYKLAREKPGQTLQPTALVHEAYLRLVGPDGDAKFANRRYFFAAAAEAMRRILVENARRKARHKHGGEHRRVDLADQPAPMPDQDLVSLDQALVELTQEDPQAAKVVELHYFAGLSHEVVAEILGITVYLARQKWTYARAWLRRALTK
ncbi:MAG: ECF-type sigma factor [Candidatus Sulfotelmatobacter sp.]